MVKKILLVLIIVLVLSGIFYFIKYKSNTPIVKSSDAKQINVAAQNNQVSPQENANCLYKFLDDFKNQDVVIVPVDDYNQMESLFKTYYNKADLNQAICKTTFPEIEQFINKNFIQISKTNPGIVQSWNYLAINKVVIYDNLKEIKSNIDSKSTSDKALVYKFNNNLYVDDYGYAMYNLDSIINNNIACYTYTAETANSPHTTTNYACKSTDNNNYKITDIFDEKEVIKAALQDSDVKDFINKQKINLTSITSLDQLFTILAKSAASDPNSSPDDCLPFSIDNFTITKQNANGTMNVTYNPDVPWLCYGDGLVYPSELTNMQPKIKISTFVLDNEL